MLRHHKMFKSRQPAVVVARSIIGFTARRIRFQFFSQYSRPLAPREVPMVRERDGKRKGLSLPRLGKDRPALIAWQAWQRV